MNEIVFCLGIGGWILGSLVSLMIERRAHRSRVVYLASLHEFHVCFRRDLATLDRLQRALYPNTRGGAS